MTHARSEVAEGRFICRHAMLLAVCFVVVAVAVDAVRADWPQYRADAARSGHVEGVLGGDLSLRWAYRAPHAPVPAWIGSDTRMFFDLALQPVIADGTLYFGSSADGKLYALDAETGEQRWTFQSDGPIRFAPALWQGRVFFVSDDGRLYCLDGETGELLWDRRGGPETDMLLGNGRMIARWPARGGPVIHDDILYFGAGIWPSEGVYLHALEPETGEVIWVNGEAGGLEWDQPHGGARAKSGISAQGYFVATDDQLIIPTGRGVPAVFDREAGVLEQFHLQAYGRIGGADIVALDTHFFNSGQLFDAVTGRSQGRAVPPVDTHSYRQHMRGHAAQEQGLEDPLTVTADRAIFAAGDRIVARRWIEEPVVHRTGEAGVSKRLAPSPVWPAARDAEPIPGRLGHAARFEDEAYIETPSFGFDYNHITIAAWVRPDDLDGRFTIFDNRNENSCPGIEVGRGNRVSVITPGVWMVETEGDVLETGRWHHIVYTRNGPGDTHAIYVDGEGQPLQTAREEAYESTATPKDVGRRGNGSQFFEGLIEHVAVYERALSDREVGELYATAEAEVDADDAEAQLPVRDGLALYLPINEPIADGTQLGDASGHGRDGIFFGHAYVEAPHAITSIISVGRSVAIGGAGRVSVLQSAGDVGDPASWTAEVEGVVHGLAFADGRLYASTDTGMIYAFAARDAAPPEPTLHEPAIAESPYGDNAHYADAAERIIEQAGVTEGYAVDLACGDGALAYELARRTELRIYAMDDDPDNVAAAREKLTAAGLYGDRVTVHLGDPTDSRYPNYFADLAVSGRHAAADAPATPQELIEELHRLQRPWGGVACIGPPESMQASRRGPLENSGTWTHQYADAGATAVSTDDHVKAPLGMLWFNDYAGVEMPMRHGRGPAPLFSEGRMFVKGVHGVYAIDAYNGRMLWEHAIPDILAAYDQHHLAGVAITGGTFCVEGDSLYVRHEGRAYHIDAATGRKQAAFNVPDVADDADAPWGFIAAVDGTLFGSTADEEHIVRFPYSRGSEPSMDQLLSESTTLFAIDPDTGEHRWSYHASYSIRHNTIVIGDGRVYLIDAPPSPEDLLDEQRRRGQDPEELPSGELVALDADTGEVLWRQHEDIFGTTLSLSTEHDRLLMSYQRTRFRIPSERGGRLATFRASDGERTLDIEADYGSRPIINGRTIYAQPGAWDLLTGERHEEFHLSRSYGCSTISGSKHLLSFRSATLGFRDLTRPDSETENYGGIRPGCWLNTIAAGGLLLMPDATDKCTCSYLNKAYIALQPM